MTTNYFKPTPEQAAQWGYTPIPTMPKGHAIAPEWYDKCRVSIPLGLQADGTCLYKLDLDNHSDASDALQEWRYIASLLGTDLARRLPIRWSDGNTHKPGLHIFIRTSKPLSADASIKVYHKFETKRHIGELIGAGQRAILDGEWLQGTPEHIPLLTVLEVDKLLGAAYIPALYKNVKRTTVESNRKKRRNQGLALIEGWKSVRNWEKVRDSAAKQSQMFAKYLALLRTATDRSTAYGRFVQSVMLHAKSFGDTTEERCKMVAAICINTGANGKEDSRDYKIELDTAVIIARILHGDSFQEDKGKWIVPKWYSGEALTQEAAPAAAPEKRSAGRPAGSKEKNLQRLYKVLDKIDPDELGRRSYFIADLAARISTNKYTVSARTVQTYLQELQRRGIIARGQIGNGAAYCIIKCAFEGADNSTKACKNKAQTVQFRGADETSVLSVDKPQTPEISIQRNKEEEHQEYTRPTVSASVQPAPAALAAGAQVLGVPSGDVDAGIPYGIKGAVVIAFDALAKDAHDPKTGELKKQRVTVNRVIAFIRENLNASNWTDKAIAYHYNEERKHRKNEYYRELLTMDIKKLYAKVRKHQYDVDVFNEMVGTGRAVDGRTLTPEEKKYYSTEAKKAAGRLKLASKVYNERTALQDSPQPAAPKSGGVAVVEVAQPSLFDTPQPTADIPQVNKLQQWSETYTPGYASGLIDRLKAMAA